MFRRLSIALLPLAATAGHAVEDLSADFVCPTSLRVTVPGGLTLVPDERGSTPSIYGSMKGLHSIMSTCSNISDLEISIHRVGGPDLPAPEDTPDRSNFPFDQAGGDFFPSRPQTLRLEAYDFGASEWEACRPPGMGNDPNYRDGPNVGGIFDWNKWFTGPRATEWLRLRHLPDEQKDKRNLHLWMEAMDFSAVSNLTLLDLRPSGTEVLVSSLAGQLPALKALSVTRIYGLDFLRAVPGQSLSHLTLRFSSLASANRLLGDDNCQTCRWRRIGIYDDASDDSVCDCKEDAAEADDALEELWLQHGGPQLETLEFRGGESGSRESREVLTTSQLQAISASSPNLRKLTIDLDRDDGVWPDAELRVLATEFPALESLSLYLEMASPCARELAEAFYYGPPVDHDQVSFGDKSGKPSCRGDALYAKPMVDEAMAGELFALLRRLNVGEGSGKLVELRLHAGDWTNPWDGPMYKGAGGLGSRTAWATCRVERVDGGEDVMQCYAYDTGISTDW